MEKVIADVKSKGHNPVDVIKVYTIICYISSLCYNYNEQDQA